MMNDCILISGIRCKIEVLILSFAHVDVGVYFANEKIRKIYLFSDLEKYKILTTYKLERGANYSVEQSIC